MFTITILASLITGLTSIDLYGLPDTPIWTQQKLPKPMCLLANSIHEHPASIIMNENTAVPHQAPMVQGNKEEVLRWLGTLDSPSGPGIPETPLTSSPDHEEPVTTQGQEPS